jgi:hypothetical protein
MVIAGGAAASMGYLAAREAKSRPTLVVTPTQSIKIQPTTNKVTARATKRKTVKSAGSRTGKRAVQRRPATAPTTRTAAVTMANPNADAPVTRQWRGMMWWGGGMLFVGLISVGYSIHERRPKAPTSGADELLNDAPPF